MREAAPVVEPQAAPQPAAAPEPEKAPGATSVAATQPLPKPAEAPRAVSDVAAAAPKSHSGMAGVGSLIRAASAVQRAETKPAPEPVTAPEPKPEPVEPVAEDESNAELRAFLRGKTVTELVRSADGAFEAKSGDVIDDVMLDAAAAHDAILMLAVSVDA